MQAEKEKTFYRTDIILLLAASFFYFSSPMLTTPLITGFSGSLGASATVMGLIGGLMNFCALLCRPLVGNLSDRISKYKLSYVGAVFMLIASLGYIFAQNPAVVIASRIINGAGFACCSVCMSTWISNLLPEDKIGSGMGIYGTMNALAMGIAPAAGVFLYEKFGYRIAFAASAVFAVLIAVIIQFITDRGVPSLQNSPLRSTETTFASSFKQRYSKDGKKKHHPLSHLLNFKVIPIALIITLFAIPYCATQSFLVTYSKLQNLDLKVGLFFPFYAAVLFFLRLTLKNYFDRASFETFLLISSLCAGASILTLTFMHSTPLMLLAAALMAGGYGIMCSVCQATAILLAGPDHRGLANSTYYIGLDLGMTLGPVIGGALLAHLSFNWFYPCLLATVPLILLVYFFGIRSSKKQKRRKAIR